MRRHWWKSQSPSRIIRCFNVQSRKGNCHLLIWIRVGWLCMSFMFYFSVLKAGFLVHLWYASQDFVNSLNVFTASVNLQNQTFIKVRIYFFGPIFFLSSRWLCHLRSRFTDMSCSEGLAEAEANREEFGLRLQHGKPGDV